VRKIELTLSMQLEASMFSILAVVRVDIGIPREIQRTAH
jgi:hypothetical protein